MIAGQMTKSVFISGGSGFIGKNLIEFLSPKYDVFAPSHQELELLDEAAVQRYFHSHTIDTVIHSAVRPGHRNAKDPTNQLYNNTRMFFNIVRNSGKFDKLIFLGSGAVYDMRHYVPKMKEEYFDAFVPADEHGFSKYISAKYVEKAVNMVELRIFGIFGKYEDYAIRFISNAICKALFDLPITLKQDRKFDYIYIDDLMPVVEYFINNRGKHRAYNVTPDNAIPLFSLAELVRKVSGKDVPIRVAEAGTGVEYSGGNARLKDEIKGLEFLPVDESIKRLYEWYSFNRASIDKDLLLVDK